MAKRAGRLTSRAVDNHEEHAQAYAENTPVDAVALNHVFEIIKQLGESDGNGFIEAQRAWFDDACPSHRIPLVRNPSQVIKDKIAIKKSVETRSMLQSTAKVLSKVLGLVSHQLEMIKENVEALKNRAGFFILPDEIMSTVLEYAALMERRDGEKVVASKYPLDEERRVAVAVRAATRLSHVCKRFRDLIVHSSTLWNRVYNNSMSNSGMVSACLSRCLCNNAEVILSTPIFEQQSSRPGIDYKRRNESFIRIVLEHSQKCKIFVLRGDSVRSPSHADSLNGSLQDYAELTKDADFPNLAVLSVSYPDTAMSSNILDAKLERFLDAMRFYRLWSMPKLQAFYIINSIPVPFSGIQSLTSLNISLSFNPSSRRNEDFVWDAGMLVSFLAVCPNLERFKLSLSSAKGAIPSKSRSAVVMPRVIFLDVCFILCGIESLEGFFGAIHFPSVTDMQLHISSYKEREARRGRALFEDIYSAVIPNAEALPKLTSLSLSVIIIDSYAESDDLVDGIFSVPFATLPHLRHLELISNSPIAPVPDGVSLPAIRTLTIVDSPAIDRNWLVKFVKRMELQGNLEGLRVLVDDNCHTLNSCGVRGSLSKEDIHQLIAAEES